MHKWWLGCQAVHVAGLVVFAEVLKMDGRKGDSKFDALLPAAYFPTNPSFNIKNDMAKVGRK